MRLTRMMTKIVLAGALAGVLHAGPALAQQQDPIAPFVIDVRGAYTTFDANGGVATLLGIESADQLAGWGPGLEIGAHVYPLRTRSFALGLGASMLFSRGSKSPAVPETEEGEEPAPEPTGPTIQTRLTAITPQVSLNFGSLRGYSYISGGIGTVTRAIEATEGTIPFSVTDGTRARTLNYGGGARWFATPHVAFTFDLRFYRVAAQEATTTSTALPGQRLFVGSVGISIH